MSQSALQIDQSLDDETLARELTEDQAGPAMQALAGRYQQRLQRYLLCLTASEEASAELFSACMTQYLEQRQRQQGKGRVKTVLFALATALAQRWCLRFPDRNAPMPVVEGAAGLDLTLRWEMLAQALQALEMRERALLCLTLFERFPYAEAADLLGMEEMPARDLAGAALAKVREQLGDSFF